MKGPSHAFLWIVIIILAVNIYLMFMPGLYKDPLLSLTHSNLDYLASVLERYKKDTGNYPAMEKNYDLPCSLTTPIAYTNSQNIIDQYPLLESSKCEPLRYFLCKKNNLWILQSCGPDGDYDFKKENYAQLKNEEVVVKYSHFTDHIYDPTNGTDSSGDIFRVRQ